VNGPENVAYGYTRSWEATEMSDWFPPSTATCSVCDGYAGYAREIELMTKTKLPSSRSRLSAGLAAFTLVDSCLLLGPRPLRVPGRRHPQARSWLALEATQRAHPQPLGGPTSHRPSRPPAQRIGSVAAGAQRTSTSLAQCASRPDPRHHAAHKGLTHLPAPSHCPSQGLLFAVWRHAAPAGALAAR
jgi:hypothetical protein